MSYLKSLDLKSLDPNQVTYWIGLCMIFAGLSLSVSVATALTVCGTVLVVTGTASSFFMTWLMER
jgi:hypothetical protein